MSAAADVAIAALNRNFLLDYPREAARRIETLPAKEVSELLAAQPLHVMLPVWGNLASDVEESLFAQLPQARASALISELEPARSAALLNRLEAVQRKRVNVLA